MAMFIGSNDHETLVGVLEEIERLIRREDGIERRATKVKTRERSVYARAVLQELHNTIKMASENGPTPDLTKLRMRVEPGLLEDMLTAEANRLAGRLCGALWDILEVEDGKGPTLYDWRIGGDRPDAIRSPKHYLDRVAALTALTDRMGTMVTEQEGTPAPVS